MKLATRVPNMDRTEPGMYEIKDIRHRASSTKWSVSNAFNCALDPWTSGFEIPKGLLGARTQITRVGRVTFSAFQK